MGIKFPCRDLRSATTDGRKLAVTTTSTCALRRLHLFVLCCQCIVSLNLLMQSRLATQRIYSFISFYSCSHRNSVKGARGIATCLNADSKRRRADLNVSLSRSRAGHARVCLAYELLCYECPLTKLLSARIPCEQSSICPKGPL